MEYGLLSLLPTVVLFILILFTKRVMFSLICAGIFASVLLGGTQFLYTWIDALQASVRSGFMGQIAVMMSLFGIYIIMMEKSQAAREFALWLSKYAKKRWQALLLTEILGILIFLDDALNNVAVGTSMRRLTDHFLVPRTLLGYITISTSAPICILLPISTWAVMNGGLMIENGVSVHDSPVETFAATCPYIFFGWVTIIVMTLVVFGIFPLVGPTKRQQKVATEKHIVISAADSRNGKDIVAEIFDDAESSKHHNPYLFLIPLLVLIGGTILFDNNVMIGCVLGILSSGVLMKWKQNIPSGEIFACGLEGVLYMAPLLLQLTLSNGLTMLNVSLKMPDFIISVVTPILSGALMPVVVFIFLTLYSSFGGGFWEMSILFMPVVMPMALQMGVNPFLAAAAVVSASAAGSSLYVCGDTEALVSSVMGTTPSAQSAAVLPFALVACAISAALFLIVGIVGM